MFTKGENGFRQTATLDVFCSTVSDGKNRRTGQPKCQAKHRCRHQDPQGLYRQNVFWPELYAAYQKPEGEITEVSYMFPRPGADKTPVAKVEFSATRVADLGCGVGYYK